MRKDLLAAVLGFVIGATALAVAQQAPERPDEELQEKLARLQEAITKTRVERWPGAQDRLPPIGAAGAELELFPVYDLTSPRYDHFPPVHHPVRGSEQPRFGGTSEEAMLPAGTVEEILELVRMSVMPQSWEEGASLYATGQTLLVINSRAAIGAIGKFLEEQLRSKVHRCVTVEAQAVDVAPGLARALAEGRGTALTPEQERLLDVALADGSAARRFSGRTTGFVGQQVYLWHGRQVAVLATQDAEIAQKQRAFDPEVDVALSGGYIAFRPSVGDDTGRLTLDFDVRLDEIEKVDTRDVGSVALDLTRRRETTAETSLTVPHRKWAVVGGGTRVAGGNVRILLVRGTVLPRNGGAK